MNKQPVQK